jgi:hypothetical protein
MRCLRLVALAVTLVLAAAAPAAAVTNGQIVGRGFQNQLLTMNPDGTGVDQRYLGAAGEIVANPAWSPDGNRIAFEDLDGTHGGRILVYDLATGVTRPATDHAATDGLGHTIIDSHPGWSADSSRISFLRSTTFGYMSVRADGSDLRSLAITGLMGSFSPDGARFAYRAVDADVAVIDADGGNAHTLVPAVNGGAPFGDDIPQWSPDGTQIVFTRNDLGSSHLMRVSAAGGAPVDVSPRQQFSDFGYPDWSPDGTQIVYNCIQCGAAEVIAVDGSNAHHLSTTTVMVYPDWQPCVAGVTASCVSVMPIVRGTRPTCPVQLTVTTQRDTPLDLPPAPCNEPQGRPLSLILVDGPQHGALGAPRADGHRTFTPARGYVGDDVIHYRATNGTETSDLATLNVHVLPGGGSGGADRRAPHVRWLTSPRLGRNHAVRVRLRCDEACRVSAHLASRLRGGRRRSGPTVRRTVVAGRTLTITLKLGRPTPSRRALRSLKILATVTDAAGNKAHVTRTVKLR